MHAKNTDSLKLRKVFSFQAVLSHIHFTDICFLDLIMCNQSKMKDYNPGQNIWNKIEKPSKIDQDKKCLVSTFAGF